MNRKVINIHQDIVNLDLGRLSQKEWDVLMVVLHMIGRYATEEHQVPLKKIKKMTGIKHDSDMQKTLATLQDKLQDLHKVDRQAGNITLTPYKLFSKFDIDNNTLTAQIDPEAVYLFGGKYYGTPTGGFGKGKYIRIDLQDFFSLKSKYDKWLYILLSQWAHTGVAVLDLDLYRHTIGQQDKGWKYINRNVLRPTMEHLSGHYCVCNLDRHKSGWDRSDMGWLEINYYKINRETGEILEPEAKKPAEKPVTELEEHLAGMPVDAPLRQASMQTGELDEPDEDDETWEDIEEINLSSDEGWAAFLATMPDDALTKQIKPAEKQPKESNVIDINSYIKKEELQDMEAYYSARPTDYYVSLLN